MNILTTSDAHVQGVIPRCRKDDTVKTQFDKWEEIVGIANINDMPIIFAGDLGNSSILSNSLLVKLGDILRSLHHALYFVWGNHDLLYHSIKIWDQTALGVLWKNNPKVKHISEFEADYGIKWDWIDWGKSISKNNAKYLLTHKAIVSKKQMKGNKWIEKDKDFAMPFNDPQLKNYKTIICGHWHKRYIINIKRFQYICRVINPGPLVRRTINETEIPTVTMVNLETGIYKHLPIYSAKPTEEVISFNEKTTINSTVDTDEIKKFITAIKSNKIKVGTKLLDIILQVIESDEIDEELQELIKEMIATIKEKKRQ